VGTQDSGLLVGTQDSGLLVDTSVEAWVEMGVVAFPLDTADILVYIPVLQRWLKL